MRVVFNVDVKRRTPEVFSHVAVDVSNFIADRIAPLVISKTLFPRDLPSVHAAVNYPSVMITETSGLAPNDAQGKDLEFENLRIQVMGVSGKRGDKYDLVRGWVEAIYRLLARTHLVTLPLPFFVPLEIQGADGFEPLQVQTSPSEWEDFEIEK